RAGPRASRAPRDDAPDPGQGLGRVRTLSRAAGGRARQRFAPGAAADRPRARRARRGAARGDARRPRRAGGDRRAAAPAHSGAARRSAGESSPQVRRRRIALIGLRGAGKTTLGTRLAERLGVPFIELDREIERESGISLATIFDLYGQAGFRRLERRCLDRVIAEHSRFVLSTGGSIVSEPATFERLLSACWTVWLRAAPAEHMQRVVAQGDMRPMAGNPESMADLQRILAGREPLYRRADAQADTSGRDVESALQALIDVVPSDAAVESAAS